MKQFKNLSLLHMNTQAVIKPCLKITVVPYEVLVCSSKSIVQKFQIRTSFVLPRYCGENDYRSFHTLQDCAGYIVVHSMLWTRFPAQKHQLIVVLFYIHFPSSYGCKAEPWTIVCSKDLWQFDAIIQSSKV